MFDGDRMNKSYSICIEYSPAYELVASFYAYTFHSNLKNYRLGLEWYEETKLKLPPSLADELADERWEVLHRVVLLIAQCPQKESVEGFLQWLKTLPVGDLYERLAPWVNAIPLNLGEIRDQSLHLLSSWNEHYFRHLEPSILTFLSEEAHLLHSRSIQSAPIQLIDEVTNGLCIEPTGQLQQVILIPQYHCYPATILDFYRGKATCMYPARPFEPTEDTSTQQLLQWAQSLADEKRIRILLYLAGGARTLSEIQQHVKLAKSTVHHHITTLRRAGMIRSHFIDNTTPAYYSLRESFIDGFHRKLEQLLLHQGAHDE